MFKVASIEWHQLIFLWHASGDILILHFQIFLLVQNCQAFAGTLHFTPFRKRSRSTWDYIIFSHLGRWYSWAHNLQTSVLSAKCTPQFLPRYLESSTQQPPCHTQQRSRHHSVQVQKEHLLLIPPLLEPLPDSQLLQVYVICRHEEATSTDWTFRRHHAKMSMSSFSCHLFDNMERGNDHCLSIRKQNPS